MKKSLIILLLLFSVSIYAKEVPADKALLVAKNFLHSSSAKKQLSGTIELQRIRYAIANPFSSSLKSAPETKELFYIFNINTDDGYIIISADDNALPVLGYSDGGSFDSENIPPNMKKWLEAYRTQIRSVQSDNTASENTKKQWDNLLKGENETYKKSTEAVSPLLSSKWNQSPYVNELCPYDYEASEYTVTGCAATAMAQIMKFWNYPATGSGFHSYNHDLYGTISANFGEATYDWGSMPDLVNSSNIAVATLMFHCGVSIDMSYGIGSEGGSGAYLLIDHSPVTHCVEYALTTYFNYDSDLRGVFRSDYSEENWISLLKEELNAGRPIEYAGFGDGGGHAFVCDGYDENDFFHFNWGWGGYYDGYFIIDALDPTGTGIGGGSGGYNSGQQAIIGIKPPDSIESYDLGLYDEVSISENPLFFTKEYTIHTDIANFGTSTFSGDFGVAIFDKDFAFVEFTDTWEGISLEGNSHYIDGIDFSSEGSINLLPGKYYAVVCFKPTGGNWIFADGKSYSNLLEFDVYYASNIELYQDFVISSGSEITQNEAFTITTDILNDGEDVYTGDFKINFYDMDGYYAGDVATLTGADLNPDTYYNDLEFSSNGISLDPGTYLMALLHTDGDGDWTLSGSSYFSNPMKVIVKQAPYEPDMYENNDEESSAYILDLNFTADEAQTSTTGSNTHLGTDIDFFKIELDEGYDYSISAQVHDSYSNESSENYTNDMLWSYYADGNWSEVYDDVMTGNIEIENGGDIIFGLAPYFEGETGTYLLAINVERTKIVSSKTLEALRLSVYPNPATNFIQIDASKKIQQVKLYDLQGKLIQDIRINESSARMSIESLKPGVYMLKIEHSGKVDFVKLVKGS